MVAAGREDTGSQSRLSQLEPPKAFLIQRFYSLERQLGRPHNGASVIAFIIFTSAPGGHHRQSAKGGSFQVSFVTAAWGLRKPEESSAATLDLPLPVEPVRDRITNQRSLVPLPHCCLCTQGCPSRSPPRLPPPRLTDPEASVNSTPATTPRSSAARASPAL